MEKIGLSSLEQLLYDDLHLIERPASPWIINRHAGTLDVAIVGGGMAGLAVAANLLIEGISNLHLFDANPEGYEGPWKTYARMRFLRSGKQLAGPALNLPHLTFQAWFIAQYGVGEWESLYKIPTSQWMDYLKWYRKVMRIPLSNEAKVTLIEPSESEFLLHFHDRTVIKARKVILATGRNGFGGANIPEWAQAIPKDYYAHTAEKIDFRNFKGQDIVILGVGASGFDAAATALEAEAKSVTMICRRESIGNVNKPVNLVYPGYGYGYYLLPDESKLLMMDTMRSTGAVPPFESLDRVKAFTNFRVLTKTSFKDAAVKNSKLTIKTDNGDFPCDYLILASGFAMNGRNQSELRLLIDDIQLWGDLYAGISERNKKYPYLGKHFQFIEKNSSKASYLKNIYCFNSAATLTHGIVSSDIPDISIGAQRLTKGVCADFFKDDWSLFFQGLKDYNKIEFMADQYPFMNRKDFHGGE